MMRMVAKVVPAGLQQGMAVAGGAAMAGGARANAANMGEFDVSAAVHRVWWSLVTRD